MKKTCKHEIFEARVDVARIEMPEGKPVAFMADVKVHCGRCGESFQFLGLPAGMNMQGASVSVDGLEARLAICPHSDAPTPLDNIFTKTSTAH